MSYKISVVTLSALLALVAHETAMSLEVDREVLPRTTLAGRVVATLDATDLDSESEDQTKINIDDTTLLLRFDKRTYAQGVAGGVLGVKENDDALKFHQAHVFYWSRFSQAMLGRSTLKNTLIEFPTARDDDLLTYTHVGNASSDDEEFDAIYGEIVSLDWFFRGANEAFNVWGGTRRNGEGFDSAPDELDSLGGGYEYAVSEDMHYVKRLRQVGVVLDRQEVNTESGDKWMNAYIAGAEFNLNMNPVQNWSFAMQGIFNEGVSGEGDLTTASGRARAEYVAVATTLRYTARPQLLTRWQGALTVAYKDYSDVSEASQWSFAPSVAYRLGQGIDIVAQVIYTDYDDGLFGGGDDRVAQIGMAFNLDAVFNDNIGERNSILNLEHGYIK